MGPNSILFIVPPPKDVSFNSLEELVQWYLDNPKRWVIVENIGPSKDNNDDHTSL